jgi:hypothetical protein
LRGEELLLSPISCSVSILGSTLLARLALTRPPTTLDVLRRRRTALLQNLSAVLHSTANDALVQAITQTHSPLLTSQAVDLSALIARVGGRDAGAVKVSCLAGLGGARQGGEERSERASEASKTRGRGTECGRGKAAFILTQLNSTRLAQDAIFAKCVADSDRVRSNMARVETADAEVDRLRSEANAAKEDLGRVKFEVERKSEGYKRELAEEKNRAVRGAQELARYQEQRANDAERLLADAKEKIKELERGGSELERRLEEVLAEGRGVGEEAKRALEDEMEARQTVVKVEGELWEERERGRAMERELEVLRKEVEEQRTVGGMFERQQSLIGYINQLSGVGDMKAVGPPPAEIMGELEVMGGERWAGGAGLGAGGAVGMGGGDGGGGEEKEEGGAESPRSGGKIVRS